MTVATGMAWPATARPAPTSLPTSCCNAVTLYFATITTHKRLSFWSGQLGLKRGKGSILEALGRAYFNSGQYARAAETFEALLEVDPSAHYGHFALGLSFVRLGRTPEAKTQLRLAVALDPASETYRRSLEKIDSRGD